MARPLPVLLAPRRRTTRQGWVGGSLALTVAALAIALLAHEARAAPSEPGLLALIWKWTPLMFSGFLFNLLISVLAMAIGTAAGLGLGLGQISPVPALRRAAWLVTQFFRNAPWLVLLFYCILLIPFEVSLFGARVPFPAWIKAVIGLALPVMANVAEIVRGAVQSIPTGQWEAAESLAFSRRQVIWMIILPQCV